MRAVHVPRAPIERTQPRLNRPVLDDDEFPILSVRPGRRLEGEFYQMKHQCVVHRVGLEPADCPLRAHRFLQWHVQDFRLGHDVLQRSCENAQPYVRNRGLEQRQRAAAESALGTPCCSPNNHQAKIPARTRSPEAASTPRAGLRPASHNVRIIPNAPALPLYRTALQTITFIGRCLPPSSRTSGRTG